MSERVLILLHLFRTHAASSSPDLLLRRSKFRVIHVYCGGDWDFNLLKNTKERSEFCAYIPLISVGSFLREIREPGIEDG